MQALAWPSGTRLQTRKCQTLVSPSGHGHRPPAGNLLQYDQCRVLLRPTVGLEDFCIHDDSVVIFDQANSRGNSTSTLYSLLRARRALGPAFDSCVSFDRFALRKFTVGLPGSSGGIGFPVSGGKLFAPAPGFQQRAIDREMLRGD
jgi:hypothetical protein